VDPLPKTLVNDWKIWFLEEGSRVPGLDLYPELFSHPILFPLQRMRETAAMMRMAASVSPSVVMEIGADKGGSFYHWVKCHPGVKKAIACEIRGTPYEEEFVRAFPGVRFLFLADSSFHPRTVQRVRKFLGNDSMSCLFIDGDKNKFAEDFYAYQPFLRPGGLALMHDICCAPSSAGCADAFNEVGKNFRSETIIDLSEHEEDKLANARGEPVSGSYGGWVRYWNLIPTCGVGVIHV
jgi:predicted O-methyltransferase YrrM